MFSFFSLTCSLFARSKESLSQGQLCMYTHMAFRNFNRQKKPTVQICYLLSAWCLDPSSKREERNVWMGSTVKTNHVKQTNLLRCCKAVHIRLTLINWLKHDFHSTIMIIRIFVDRFCLSCTALSCSCSYTYVRLRLSSEYIRSRALDIRHPYQHTELMRKQIIVWEITCYHTVRDTHRSVIW